MKSMARLVLIISWLTGVTALPIRLDAASEHDLVPPSGGICSLNPTDYPYARGKGDYIEQLELLRTCDFRKRTGALSPIPRRRTDYLIAAAAVREAGLILRALVNAYEGLKPITMSTELRQLRVSYLQEFLCRADKLVGVWDEPGADREGDGYFGWYDVSGQHTNYVHETGNFPKDLVFSRETIVPIINTLIRANSPYRFYTPRARYRVDFPVRPSGSVQVELIDRDSASALNLEDREGQSIGTTFDLATARRFYFRAPDVTGQRLGLRLQNINNPDSVNLSVWVQEETELFLYEQDLMLALARFAYLFETDKIPAGDIWAARLADDEAMTQPGFHDCRPAPGEYPSLAILDEVESAKKGVRKQKAKAIVDNEILDPLLHLVEKWDSRLAKVPDGGYTLQFNENGEGHEPLGSAPYNYVLALPAVHAFLAQLSRGDHEAYASSLYGPFTKRLTCADPDAEGNCEGQALNWNYWDILLPELEAAGPNCCERTLDDRIQKRIFLDDTGHAVNTASFYAMGVEPFSLFRRNRDEVAGMAQTFIDAVNRDPDGAPWLRNQFQENLGPEIRRMWLWGPLLELSPAAPALFDLARKRADRNDAVNCLNNDDSVDADCVATTWAPECVGSADPIACAAEYCPADLARDLTGVGSPDQSDTWLNVFTGEAQIIRFGEFSCAGHCGGDVTYRNAVFCRCDSDCHRRGDCCGDKVAVCGP